MSLLLPAVLVWSRNESANGGTWLPAPDFKAALWGVFQVVTAFTLAHSITSSLAVPGFAHLPSRFVGSVIAVSGFLQPSTMSIRITANRWIVAFCFGLIHGFGFANVLVDLGLPDGALAVALVGFNLGVEAGQMAIVALFLPLAYVVRRTLFYRRGVFVGGSFVIASIAVVWFAERAFNMALFSLLG